jgi:peptidoglycan/LPS O-acetylase OafA/YrhL
VTIVPPPAKLGWVEAYRGIAATAVVLYHTARHFDKNYGIPALESVFQFGHAGVDLFFVISGFIILFVIGAKKWASLHFSLAPARIGQILCGCAAATRPLRSEPCRA